MHDSDCSDWPLGSRLAALAEPAIGLLAYTRRLRRDPLLDLDPDSYERRLLAKTCVRASEPVAGLAEADDPLISAVREVVQAVTGGPDLRDPALDHQLGALAAAVEVVLRRNLPAAPETLADHSRRVAALAARRWIGAEVHGCPRGWLPLLERAARQADSWLDGQCFGRTVQIKEKLGTLRWYLRSAPAELRIVVNLAERASEGSCLACGQPWQPDQHRRLVGHHLSSSRYPRQAQPTRCRRPACVSANRARSARSIVADALRGRTRPSESAGVRTDPVRRDPPPRRKSIHFLRLDSSNTRSKARVLELER